MSESIIHKGIVMNPTAGDVHVNTPLTNFSQKYLQGVDSFIALRAFPNAPVAKQSDLFYTFDRDDFYRDEAEERADGTESSGSGFELSTDPYFARVYAFHKDITDRQRANADIPVQLDQSAAQFVTHKLLIRREKLFADAYFAAGKWATDNDSVNWSTATGDPIIDFRNAARKIQMETGYRPNKAIFGRQAYDTVLDNDAVLARITGGATTEMPAQVMRRYLAAILEVEEIFVMDAIETTSKKGASTTARGFIGGDNVLLYYAPNSVALNEPTAGLQFSWTGFLGATDAGARIRRFRNEPLQADRIEGEMAFDYRLTGTDLGYFFQNVSS